MKQRTITNIQMFLCGILLVFCFAVSMEANATGNKPDTKAQATSEASAQAAADSSSYSEGSISNSSSYSEGSTSTSNSYSGDSTSNSSSYSEGSTSSASSQGGAASASNEGNSMTVEGDRVENNSSNVVLVPNNNTESCLRVFGIAFGKNGESGALGIPWRSAKCDYEQAADDAFAAGERDLGWFWKCQNKNLYKRFIEEGYTKNQAIEDCHLRMLSTTSRDEVVERLEQRLQATEKLLELERSHQEVCDESLDRCENIAYGSK